MGALMTGRPAGTAGGKPDEGAHRGRPGVGRARTEGRTVISMNVDWETVFAPVAP